MIVNKLRFVAVDYIATHAWTLDVYTDIPGPARALLCTITFQAKSTRGLVRVQLPKNARTVSIERRFTPNLSGDLELYDVQWYRRPLGGSAGWSWWQDPDIPQTPEAWSTMQLPIEGTSDQFSTVQLPIEGTSDQFQVYRLPIEGTEDAFRTESLGIDESGTDWRFVDVPGGES